MKTLLEVVTVDGPAGAGKSTVARALAGRLGFRFLDTGAMYRALTWAAQQAGLAAEPGDAIAAVAGGLELDFRGGDRLLANGADVTEAIRSREVTVAVSKFAALPEVRRALARSQRAIGERGEIVCEGRDMGTVVFPDAAVKFYLDASPEVRARRRQLELEQKGTSVDFGELLAEIEARDEADRSREASPLKRVPEQIYVDSSDESREEVLERMERIARELLARDG